MKDKAKTEVKSQVDNEMADLKKRVVNLQIRMDSAEKELSCMKKTCGYPIPTGSICGDLWPFDPRGRNGYRCCELAI